MHLQNMRCGFAAEPFQLTQCVFPPSQVVLILPQLKVDPAEYQAMLKERAGEIVEEAPLEAAEVLQAVAAGRGGQQRGSGPRRRA